MCPELLLALLYFLTILVVNYFLYKVLIESKEKIIYLFKIRTILKTFKNEKLILFSRLNRYEKSKSILSLKVFNEISFPNDIFIIGNTYKYLTESLKNEQLLDLRTVYYLSLIENQYLSNPIRLK
jgi:hypothetical protein